MRCPAFILSVFILFLAVKPGIDVLICGNESSGGCCGEICTTSSEGNQDRAEHDECPDGSCNPFQVCSSCAFVLRDMNFDLVPKISALIPEEFGELSDPVSQFSPDFWQPPKVV